MNEASAPEHVVSSLWQVELAVVYGKTRHQPVATAGFTSLSASPDCGDPTEKCYPDASPPVHSDKRSAWSVLNMGDLLLLESLTLANRILNSVDAVFSYWDRDLKCKFTNTAHQNWHSKSEHEILGISIGELLGPLFEPTLPHVLAVLSGEAQLFERMTTSADGTIRQSLITFHPDMTDDVVRGFSEHSVDVTNTKHLEFELQKCKKRADLLATHDFLTGLPTRFLLIDRISALLSQAENKGTLVGIVLLDVDAFKMLNDAYELNAGDSILAEIARRMKSVTNPNETMVRLSGDDFVCLVTGIHSPAQVQMSVSRILGAVQKPLQFGRDSITPTL